MGLIKTLSIWCFDLSVLWVDLYIGDDGLKRIGVRFVSFIMTEAFYRIT